MRSRDKLKPLYCHYHNAYGHQDWEVVDYFGMFLPIKSHAFITSSPKIRWQTKNISTTTGPMATILGWMITYLDGLLLIKFHNFDQMAFQDTWETKAIVVSIASKLGRMVTYLEGLHPKSLRDPFVTWLCKITWQTWTIISPLGQYLWSSDLARWWLILRHSYRSHMTFWLRVLQDYFRN